MSGLDPAIVGVWIVPGLRRTYEVDAAGGYHVADPEGAIAFVQGGAVMVWEGEPHDRRSGAGATPEGRWIGRETGAEWVFAADGSYTATLDGQTDTGIWALREDGRALWTRELVATLTTAEGLVDFALRAGGVSRYGYAVADGVWTLHDPVTRAELARFVDPGRLAAGG